MTALSLVLLMSESVYSPLSVDPDVSVLSDNDMDLALPGLRKLLGLAVEPGLGVAILFYVHADLAIQNTYCVRYRVEHTACLPCARRPFSLDWSGLGILLFSNILNSLPLLLLKNILA